MLKETNDLSDTFHKEPRYYDLIAALFVAILIISNIASSKIISFGVFAFDGGTILFPISYIFGDILTEVYGYSRARRIIWIGFSSLVMMSITLSIIQYLPADPAWQNQKAYETILGLVPRIALGSIVAFWMGEFVNSYSLAKLKILTKGKFLWIRTIGSTVVGQAVDSIIFTIVAFGGTMPFDVIINIITTIYLMKVGFEILATPVTYLIVNKLKRTENVDHYDNKTNFNPFVTLTEKNNDKIYAD